MPEGRLCRDVEEKGKERRISQPSFNVEAVVVGACIKLSLKHSPLSPSTLFCCLISHENKSCKNSLY